MEEQTGKIGSKQHDSRFNHSTLVITLNANALNMEKKNLLHLKKQTKINMCCLQETHFK